MTRTSVQRGPEMAQGCPDQTVQGVQCWPGPFAFEHGNLLPEGEDFKSRVASAAEEDADHGEDGEDEFCHEITLVT
jgi:hypothetical protein